MAHIQTEETRIKIGESSRERWRDSKYKTETSYKIKEARTCTIDQIRERFWSHVDKQGEDECWNWKRALNRKGYGIASFMGRSIGSHRVAFILSGGELTDDKKLVCHHCDNPACCNPKHLFAGSDIDNMRDMFSKNRQNRARGEQFGRSGLKESDILDIRNGYKGMRQKDIAEIYGVSKGTIQKILIRKTWKHI